MRGPCMGYWTNRRLPAPGEALPTLTDIDSPNPPARMRREQIIATAARVKSAVVTPVPAPGDVRINRRTSDS